MRGPDSILDPEYDRALEEGWGQGVITPGERLFQREENETVGG